MIIDNYFYIVLQSWVLFTHTNNTTFHLVCYGVSPLYIGISLNMWFNMDTMTDRN